MSLHYNISFSIAAVFIVAVLLMIVSMNYSSSNIVNKRFKIFLISLLVMFVLDIATAVTNDYGDKIPGTLNAVLNTFYFFSSCLVAVFFLYYCVSLAFSDVSKKTRRIFYEVNLALVAVYAILLLINIFAGFFFYFDAQGQYTHGPAYVATNAISILFIIESLAIFIAKHKHFNKRQMVATIVFYAVFFGSFLLQLFVFPDILLSSFGSAVGTLVVFFSIETPDYTKLMDTLNELNELKASLEIQVLSRTHELDEEKESYEELTLETLSSLALVIDAKDHYTEGHSFRVAAYAKGLAEQVGMSAQECEQIYFAGLIHDVGKIGISESILSKPGALTKDEYDKIKAHSELGGDILGGIKRFEIFEQVARSHHERYDGTGYPDKLMYEEIPYAARIVTICDVFDAMTSDRSYRKALTDEKAFDELVAGRGTQFDPVLVDEFLALCRKYPDSIRRHVDDLAGSLKTISANVKEAKPEQQPYRKKTSEPV